MKPGARRARLAGASCLVVAFLGLLIGIVVPGVAHASASASNGHVLIDLGRGGGFTSSPHGALLDMTRLAPGLTTSAQMGVRNDYGAPSDLYLKFTDVTDRDGACRRPGDSGCGGSRGQLGAQLVFAIAVADSATGAYRPTWSGSAAQLEQGLIVVAIPSASARWVRLSAALPESAGNETQLDRFGFGLRVQLQSDLGTDAVSVGGAASRSGVLGLAVTGTSLVLLAVGALTLVVCGVLFLISARRRPDGATTPS